MKLKKMFPFFIFFVLFSFQCHVFGASVTSPPAPYPADLKIEVKNIDQSYTGLQISGEMPVLEIVWEESGREVQAESFTKEVNEAIEKIYREKTQEAQRGRANLLHFDYEVKRDPDDPDFKNLVSVLIKTAFTRGAVRNEINTVNFHMEEGRFLTISSVLGPNGVEIANRVIYEEIKKNPEKYNPNYNEINDSHSFYVENEAMLIVFSENEIAASSQGPLSFSIKIGAVTDYLLPKASYYTTGSYGLKMIPLRKVCEAFGYEVKWNDNLKTVELIKDHLTISFVIDVNNYRKGEESRALEIAPEIKDATTYVPVSFFGDILGLVHSVDAKGNITFTMY